MSAAHVFANIFSKVVAGNLDALVANDTTKRDNCDFRATATYIYNHVAFRSLYVETDTKGCSHWLVDHIYVATASVLRRVANGTNLYFSRT